MNTEKTIQVNVLPVLTYNFLNVNGSKIALPDLNKASVNSPKATALPAGITLKEKVSFEEAGEIFRANKDKILIDAGIPGDPNGDTTYLHTSQAVRTGMGAEIDNLMISAGANADIYTAEENQKVTEPVVIPYHIGNSEAALSAQVIHAKKNSDITVIFTYDSDDDAEGFCGVSTRVFAEEGAHVTICKVQTFGNGVVHFDDFGGACLEKAKVDLVSLELGGCKGWNGSYVYLSGRESVFNSNMGYLCRDDHSLDINYVTDHRGKKTEGYMQFKGVLMDNAQKNFRGTLDFKSGSAGSIGDEQEDALLLSPDIINKTMPVILCQEEDVEGRHGATIGQLSDELLFYMQCRGIDEEEAKRIMVKARLESVSRLIHDAQIMQKVLYYIQNIV
ncbi:MAG: SufD family Fe-S cluster assembly protein [Butyrivibrio sp.]|nr:SufD family Fe-S cluster assembly protein [Butyrivibrio sp.]